MVIENLEVPSVSRPTARLPHAEVTAVSLEFGTVSSMKVFTALRAENCLNHYGGADHSRTLEIQGGQPRALHRDDTAWMDKVWMVVRRVVQKALAWTGAREAP